MDKRYLFLTLLSIGIFISAYVLADCESCGNDEAEEGEEVCEQPRCLKPYSYYPYCSIYQKSCVATEEKIVEPMWPSRREQHQLWDELTR